MTMINHWQILGTALLVVLALNAQAGKVYRIGYLTAGSAKAFRHRLAAFRQGLKALGYVEGRNIVMEEPIIESI